MQRVRWCDRRERPGRGGFGPHVEPLGRLKACSWVLTTGVRTWDSTGRRRGGGGVPSFIFPFSNSSATLLPCHPSEFPSRWPEALLILLPMRRWSKLLSDEGPSYPSKSLAWSPPSSPGTVLSVSHGVTPSGPQGVCYFHLLCRWGAPAGLSGRLPKLTRRMIDRTWAWAHEALPRGACPVICPEVWPAPGEGLWFLRSPPGADKHSSNHLPRRLPSASEQAGSISSSIWTISWNDVSYEFVVSSTEYRST